MREVVRRPHTRNGDQFDALNRSHWRPVFSPALRRKVKRLYRRLERRLGKKECADYGRP